MKSARLGVEEDTYCDRISHLHDDLLLRILSFIPVHDAMSTRILSKRWKSLWKMMPTLEYDEKSFANAFGFQDFCRRSLQLHEAPLLKTLNLKLRRHSDLVDSFLFPNIRSTLLEITITSTSYPYCTIRFSDNIRVFQTLVVLKLHGNILLDVVGSPVCFISLKILHLKCVEFKSEESFCKLLSACPVLENLFLKGLCNVGYFSFTISVPSLQILFISTWRATWHVVEDPILKIKVPSLKYLKIKDRVGSFSFIEDMPNLVEANVMVNLSKNGKLLNVLTPVEHLSLDLYPSMVFHLTDSLIFHRLVHLELDIYNNFVSNVLLHFLKNFPKLRALKLKHTHPNYDIEDRPCLVSEPSSVPTCLSFHLETLQWIGYAGRHEEIEAAVYILKNAYCLRSATISLLSTGTENGLMLIKELLSMSKAAVYILKNAYCLRSATISLLSTGTENGLMLIKELLSMSKAAPLCEPLIVFEKSSPR